MNTNEAVLYTSIIIFLCIVCSAEANNTATRVAAGKGITLSCPSNPNAWKYRWQKYNNAENSYYNLMEMHRYHGIDNNYLTIQTTQSTDAGIYQCNVFDEDGKNIGFGNPITLVVVTNGNWGEWSSWNSCPVTCGTGISLRTRQCNNPAPSGGGLTCDGVNQETQSCITGLNCPVDGHWGTWESWTLCSVSCGMGTKHRSRTCKGIQHGGLACRGWSSETESCDEPTCAVDGMWNVWSPLSSCSVTCGIGLIPRTRKCNKPPPSNGGQNCSGDSSDQIKCENIDCPVDGNWTSWSEWSLCTTSCGGGNRTRTRDCTNPSPLYGGHSCTGGNLEDNICSVNDCQENSNGAVVGGAVGAAMFVLIIVVIVVILLRKRKKNSTDQNTSKSTKRSLYQARENVIFRPEPTIQGNVYFNIGRASGLSCTDTDDDEQQESKTVPIESDPENVYFNVALDESPILTNINVDELGEYIKKREIKEGLNDEYKTLPYGVQYPTVNATTKENMPKNRFKMIYPYDHTRVVLHDGSDYINANYIDGFEKEKCYIACQGPTKSTLVDHWRMIWQLDISKIVMLTNLVEGAKRKCERYLPEEEVVTFGSLVLTLLSVKTRATYVTREISVEDKATKEKRTIIQYHFTSWPDHGTPDPLYLVLFHRHVLSEQTTSNAGPLLVHCSAGVGRTGTYIGLDALYEQGKTTGFIDIMAFVKKMRYCRMNMVQTQEQYVCLHRALHEAFTMKDKNINKNDFGMLWRKITSDKRPINHQILREEFKMLEEKKLEHVATEHVFATSPENRDKNRDVSVLPADKDRVYLSSFEKGRTDYINAVRLPSYTKLIGYVSTQLPLPGTKVDFWTMIRDQDSSVIVMFLKEHSEADYVYSTTKATGSLGLNTLKIYSTVDEDHGIKVISLTLNKKDTKQRDIIIFQVPYNGLPEAEVLCKLMNLMSTRINLTDGPVTVVSCDGASICGLFCTFTNAVSSMTIDENADIFQLARLLQLRRPEFFKDFEEYRKVYEAVNYYLESTNVYANF